MGQIETLTIDKSYLIAFAMKRHNKNAQLISKSTLGGKLGRIMKK